MRGQPAALRVTLHVRKDRANSRERDTEAHSLRVVCGVNPSSKDRTGVDRVDFISRTWKRLTKYRWLNTVALVALGSALVVGGVYAVARGAGNSSAGRAEAVGAPGASLVATGALQVIMGQDDGGSSGDASANDSGVLGPEGPAGVDGASGLDGAPGADGVAGTNGETGPAGEQGPEGPAGPEGSVGATGPAGSQGATGAPGPGLAAVTTNGGGFELQSPDGHSYRIHVTDNGIVFYGPSSVQIWTDSTHFQTATLVP